MKRFTETEKWRDTWFRKLKPTSKLAFLYIVDNCDAAGVWDPDFELADFTIGEAIPWPTLIGEFGERLKMLPGGKWFLTRFIDFQYGELVEACRPHARVLQLLKAHSIPYRKGIGRVSIPLRNGQDNTGSGSEGAAAVPTPAITAEEIYEIYPRKEARQDAIRAIEKAMARCPSDKLLAATKAYAAAVSGWIPDDRKYIPHAATWFNRGSYEDDPLRWGRMAPQSVTSRRVPENLPEFKSA